MPPLGDTRGRKRRRSGVDDADADTPVEVAIKVTRGALGMLRETSTKLESMIKDACHGCPDSLRALQLDSMSIHNEMMALHLRTISKKASDNNIVQEAHLFQRRALDLHLSVGKMQPQSVKPKTAVTKIKFIPSSRRQARDTVTPKEALEKAHIATQTEDEKKSVEKANLGIQTTDLEPVLPAVSPSLNAEGKILKIPRFFLDTLSGYRYEEFSDEEVTKAFKIGSRLAKFMQADVFFRVDYSNIHGDLVGDLYNQYTQRGDWDPLHEDATKKRWFGSSKELRYAHYALEVLEVWRAQRETELSSTATIKPLYWALQATVKSIAYGVKWMRYLKVDEPVSVLVTCMIVENARRG
ncbi:hypothetical protein PG994_006610 [Apiospora phragmitis]|uniref:Uncharacterized protein n=1 Tax=Apiospora phragmitis TaxID=2905665 RepID=A0ABR1VJ53_9PEZI